MSTAIITPKKTNEEKNKALDRRGFLVRAGGGLSLGFFLEEVSRFGTLQAATGGTVNSWLTIGTDESIVLSIGVAEMGQGSQSTLAQILAEDLMVDFARVRTVQGMPTLASPAPLGSSFLTGGSGAIRNNYVKMRNAGAAARDMMIQAYMAQKADSSPANYSVANGVVTHIPSGTSATYGALAVAAAGVTLATPAAWVPDAKLRLIGKTVARKDIPQKTDGSAKYGIDIRLNGMVYAIIKHCPTLGGTLAKLPATPSGMLAVVPTQVVATTGRGSEITGMTNAVAVVGPDTWRTMRAAKSLSVSWNIPGSSAAINDAQFLADAQGLANFEASTAVPYSATTSGPGVLYTVEAGPTAEADIAAAPTKRDALYSLPFVAHACMEVLNCTVDYVAGVKCDIYVPTQSAALVLALAKNLTGLSESQIKVNTTYLGGGLGRKIELDFVSQAIQVGMAINKPVKLMWPREQDFTRDQYRPAALVHVRGGIDANGNIQGWHYRNVSSSIRGQRLNPGQVLGATGDSQGYEASQGLPYIMKSRSTEWVWHPSPVPVGYWRSVGASINTFAVESFIDELALAAGINDTYNYRRSRLTDPRWIAVLDAAATLGKITQAPPSGRARGIAIGTAFNSIVAQVVEVGNVTTAINTTTGLPTVTGLKVYNVAIAIDCYIPVNPGQIQAQLQGGMVHALNAALYGQQKFVAGVAQSANFNKSRMIRPNEMPTVAVTVIPAPSMGLPPAGVNIGGVGELAVPTFAPALANAVAKLVKIRQRSLPFFPGATMGD